MHLPTCLHRIAKLKHRGGVHRFRCPAALLLLATMLVVGQNAQAFRFLDVCGTTPATVPGANPVMDISNISFPPGNSFRIAIERAMSSWTQVRGAGFRFFSFGSNDFVFFGN
ncbi:MAG: hypothetical protein ACI8PT_004952, partial [Gammaproteobacteria bacterium]